MKLVIYNRFRPKIAHLINKMPRRTLCGRQYPSSRGPQTIFTDDLRLCYTCQAVLRTRKPMTQEKKDG